MLGTTGVTARRFAAYLWPQYFPRRSALPRSGSWVKRYGRSSHPGQIHSSPCVFIIAEVDWQAKSQVGRHESFPRTPPRGITRSHSADWRACPNLCGYVHCLGMYANAEVSDCFRVPSIGRCVQKRWLYARAEVWAWSGTANIGDCVLASVVYAGTEVSRRVR